MKHFMKIFLIIILLLFTYIFFTSINQIYEKNHLVSSDMNAYVVTNSDVDSMSLLFDELTANLSNDKIQIIKNTISETYNSTYEFYCLPLDTIRKRQPATLSMHYKYMNLEKDDFIDSSGLFYTSMDKEKIKQIASSVGIEIETVIPEKISYSVFLELCLTDFIILFAVIQIVFCIYTSYSIKKIGIKKSMGYSTFSILKEQIMNVIHSYFCISGLILAFIFIFLIITNRITLFLLLFLISYYIIIACIITILILNTSFIFNMISLEEMIKNKSINTPMNIAAQFIKVLFTFVISFSIIKVVNETNDYRKSQDSVFNYKYLENYYTSDGFSSEMYDKVYRNKDELGRYANRMQQMYNNENALLCDRSKIELKKSSMQNDIPEYIINTIVVNKTYLEEFSDIVLDSNYNDLDKYTIYVSDKYKDNITEIQEFIDSCLFEMCNASAMEFNIKSQNIIKPKSNIRYIDDNSKVKYLTDNGFQEQNVEIIIIDNGHSDGTYYLNALNSGYIFYNLDSRDEFKALINKYKLDGLISPGTLLTPYLTEFENVQFKLKTFIVFAIVFSISLAFIIYISGYVDIIVNKSRYALKETLGFGHINILKKRYVFLCVELLIIILLGILMKIYILFMAIAVIVDLIIYEMLYRAFINKKIYEIVKGA